MTQEDVNILIEEVKPLNPPLNDEDRRDPVRVVLAIYDRIETVSNNVNISIKISKIAYDKSCGVELKQTAFETVTKTVAYVGGVSGALVTLVLMFLGIKK
jgi:hypothetical protein